MLIKPYSIDLSDQMATCDANYIRILKLLEGADSNNRREIAFSAVGGVEQTATLEVIETFTYTSTVKLSQHVALELEQYRPPEMLIRMYHDASTAEVISYQSQRHFKPIYQLSNSQMRAPDEKQQLNVFLAEWLKVCLDKGLCINTSLSEAYQACLIKEL